MTYLKRIAIRCGGILVALLLLLSMLQPASHAQMTDAHYFPETGHYVQGLFRVFWEENGGLTNFGFPITEEYVGPDGRIIQYFERARFERTTPDLVELGRLGAEVSSDRIFPKVPPVPNTPTRRYIEETQHTIQHGFKLIWETRGAERIFGFPISEEIDEILENGQWHTVQYFERARFEYWPEYPEGQRVLLSNLGSKFAPPDRIAPVPPGVAPPPLDPISPPIGEPGPETPNISPTPEVPLPPRPPDVFASVTPRYGPPGTVFAFDAYGFRPNERVGIWLTTPLNQHFEVNFGNDNQGRPIVITADSQGSLTNQGITIMTDDTYMDGLWSFHAQGISSDHQTATYFFIDRSFPAPAPTATPIPQPTTTPIPQPTATPAPSQPTATPAPGQPTTTPEQQIRTCEQTEPSEREGATAWMTERNPPRNTETTACVRLIIDGRRRGNEPATISVLYHDRTREYDVRTDRNGTASVTFNIGRARQGYEVKVRVRFDELGDEYRAETEFLPH